MLNRPRRDRWPARRMSQRGDMSRGESATFPIREFLKRLAFRSGIIKTTYDYLLEPNELLELMLALRRGESLPGDIIEVGVARGRTTVFLNRFLDSLNSA